MILANDYNNKIIYSKDSSKIYYYTNNCYNNNNNNKIIKYNLMNINLKQNIMKNKNSIKYKFYEKYNSNSCQHMLCKTNENYILCCSNTDNINICPGYYNMNNEFIECNQRICIDHNIFRHCGLTSSMDIIYEDYDLCFYCASKSPNKLLRNICNERNNITRHPVVVIKEELLTSNNNNNNNKYDLSYLKKKIIWAFNDEDYKNIIKF